ncbi:MAG: hypothetical protein ING59_11010, partial [Burkholderiales bacterium]|nr:hypothetical protein [Burkholderiales bacterium]
MQPTFLSGLFAGATMVLAVWWIAHPTDHIEPYLVLAGTLAALAPLVGWARNRQIAQSAPAPGEVPPIPYTPNEEDDVVLKALAESDGKPVTVAAI